MSDILKGFSRQCHVLGYFLEWGGVVVHLYISVLSYSEAFAYPTQERILLKRQLHKIFAATMVDYSWENLPSQVNISSFHL